ncbi:MAG: NADH-quinone oxidoreductase subunit NuoH [Acidobacteria bacterium]|nr:NADH-quinone oxidoreductase subunit NuoH [Acidobacteriota bacterium]MCG3195024.1 NADH-quinone oxidoreductase subunit H [Thermoanaerobaculia bacterium]MCK6681469.1 NADH-quinone oxidoreductase subunit NuoH [Thermoanaerobaculia bacterium]
MSESILYYGVIPAIKAVVIVLVMATAAGVLTLFERRLLALLQVRKGPNRVGWEGSLQWVADTFKLLFKEDIVPAKADKVVHYLAPLFIIIPAMTVFAVLPWGPEVSFFGIKTPLYAMDVNIGLLFVLAVTTIGIYGVILAGWSSNSKYSLIGGLRSAAQLISYEVPMGFAVAAIIVMGQTLSLVEIIEAQKRMGLWFIFPGLVAFFLYFVSGVAETNRTPFDLPEAESELVAGFHTEYSGFKWSMFFLSEYANMVTVSAIATTLFFGGWLRPFPNVAFLSFLDFIPPIIWFLLKVSFFMFVYIWFRGTFPRYRFDQLMALGWKFLIPLSLGNIVLVAIAALWGKTGLTVLGTILTIAFAAGIFLAFRVPPKRLTVIEKSRPTEVPA